MNYKMPRKSKKQPKNVLSIDLQKFELESNRNIFPRDNIWKVL